MKLSELENFFTSTRLELSEPIQLDQCTRIVDVNKFIETHIAILKAHPGNSGYKCYYDRLKKLYDIAVKKG